MSFAVHHGPNGSYKTFSVVQRFVIDALYKGRVVVTNIRGMDNIQNIEDAFKKPLPKMAELIFIDWEDPEHPEYLQLLQRWFHWIPFGALFVLDECHNFYPKDTESFLSTLDNFSANDEFYTEPLGGSSFISPVTNKEIFRPKDVLNAFRMHRHYEWDIFFTTPDIDFLPKKIRLSAEYCYRHRNLEGLVPFKKGKWKEVQHSARTTGDSQASQLQTTEYKRDPRVFKCYSSTATGSHKQSIAGKSILSGGKIKAVGLLFAIALSYLIYTISNYQTAAERLKINTESAQVVSSKSVIKDNNLSYNNVKHQLHNEKSNNISSLDKLVPGPDLELQSSQLRKIFKDFYIRGFSLISSRPSYILYNDIKNSVIVTKKLMNYGYMIVSHHSCKLTIIDLTSKEKIDIFCPIEKQLQIARNFQL